MYFEASHVFDDDLSVFSRYTDLEDLSGDLLSVSIWSRPLGSAEVANLVAGGVGPSEQEEGVLLAHCTTEATHTHVLDYTAFLRTAQGPAVHCSSVSRLQGILRHTH